MRLFVKLLVLNRTKALWGWCGKGGNIHSGGAGKCRILILLNISIIWGAG